MNDIYASLRMTTGGVAILLAVASTAVDARGYSPRQPVSNGTEQQVEARLSQVEKQQRALQEETAAEFQKLRAELQNVKNLQPAKASLTTGK